VCGGGGFLADPYREREVARKRGAREQAGDERLMAERLADLRALVGWLARHEAALLDTIARALA